MLNPLTQKPTTTTTRRALLASLPVATATLMPVAATALGGLATPMAGDAELLALAAQFEPIFAQWIAFQISDREDRRKFEEFVERRTGVKLANTIGSDETLRALAKRME